MICSCTDKGQLLLQHKYSGVWEIEKFEKYSKVDEGSFKLDSTFEEVGFVELWDNMDDIGDYNDASYKVVADCSCKALTRMSLNNLKIGPCYWYADGETRLTLWCKIDFNYTSWENYSTFYIDKKSKNKTIWTFYYYEDDTTQLTPYREPNFKEVYTMKRKSH